ncbi:unnamed protein product [Mytilus edulis]|uniref:Uncharacterized protein n=1 Tax=Mytilus edulis TaxID=6550 RepID=A0A8S3R0Q0_MYTED|nr:unnamed protein product [Mytilus edulis]
MSLLENRVSSHLPSPAKSVEYDEREDDEFSVSPGSHERAFLTDEDVDSFFFSQVIEGGPAPEPTSKSDQQPHIKETEFPPSLKDLRYKVYTLMRDEAHIPFASPSKPKKPSTFEASYGVSQEIVSSHNSFHESGNMAFALQFINEGIANSASEKCFSSASQLLGTAEHFLAATGHLLNSEDSVVPAAVRPFLLQLDLLLESPLIDKMFGLPVQLVQEELGENYPPVKVSFLISWKKLEIIPSQDFVLTLFTDASTLGWGAYLEGLTISGIWNQDLLVEFYINVLEMKAVLLALNHFQLSLKNQSVILATDNTTVVAYLKTFSLSDSQIHSHSVFSTPGSSSGISDLSVKTIWICKCISLANGSSKAELLNSFNVKAYDVRGTSWALFNSASLEEVLSAGFWRNENSFVSPYLQSMATFTESLYSLGP